MPLDNTIIWNDAEYKRMARGPDGAVVRDLQRRGVRMEAAAKNFATGNGGGPRVRTGHLRSSIFHAIEFDAIGAFLVLGARMSYAGFVEEGTSRSRPYPYIKPALLAGFN